MTELLTGMAMKLVLAIVAGALLIAGSILFIERWQISAVGFGYAGDGERGSDTQEEKVFLLDRWTGKIEYCAVGGGDPKSFAESTAKTGHAVFTCAYPKTDGAQPAGPPPGE
jgi:hypothetical protein